MEEKHKEYIIFFLVGLIIGVVLTAMGGVFAYQVVKGGGVQVSLPSAPSLPSFGGGKKFALSFEDAAEHKFFEGLDAHVEVVRNNATKGKHSLLVNMKGGKKYPGISWEVYGSKVRSFKGASNFHFDVFNNMEDHVSLNVKIKSGKKYPKKSFEYHVELDPLKMNHVSIPVSRMAERINVSQISYIKIYVQSPDVDKALYFDNFRTE